MKRKNNHGETPSKDGHIDLSEAYQAQHDAWADDAGRARAETAERIAKHPMNTPSDLAYFRAKGYSDEEVLAFWDRDQSLGYKPTHHRSFQGDGRQDVWARLAPRLLDSLQELHGFLAEAHAEDKAAGHYGDERCSYCRGLDRAAALIAEAQQDAGEADERHTAVAGDGPHRDPAEPAVELQDSLQDCMSPQAVAAIAAHLHGIVKIRDEKVNGEVAWFTEQLLDMLGEQYNALCEEIGL